ncbi:MAG TPA: hypothetical protein VFA78_03780 [Chloroflexota bacterium]|nr:hypothetical protein [Chloroflexota bacterium]
MASSTVARPALTASSSRLRVAPVASLTFIVPALAVYGLFSIWPAIQVIWLSFQQWTGYGPAAFDGLANFRQLFADPLFHTSVDHSLLWEAGAVLTVIPGLAIALLLLRSRHPLPTLALIFLPSLLPATIVAALAVMIYSPLSGPLNTILNSVGLGQPDWLGDPKMALPALFAAWLWSTIGIVAVVLWAGLRAIGREFLDLAAVEGAGPVATFRYVILPALRRPLAIAVLVEAALGLQVFDLIFVTTGGGPGYATVTIPVDIYGRAFGGQPGQGAAEAAIGLLLGLALVGVAITLLGRSPSLGGFESTDRRATWPATAWSGIIAVLVLLPLLWLVPAGAESTTAFALGESRYSLAALGANFAAAWSGGMAGALLTSLILAAIVVAASLALAFPAAFVLAHAFPRPLAPVILGVLLIGLFQPAMVSLIPLFRLLKDLGLLGTPWGIILPEIARGLSFGIPILWIGLAGMTELLEAGAVDGAGLVRQAWSIALPLARSALAVAAVWAFVISWNEYLLPTIVSQDGSLQTVPTLLATFIGRYNTQYGSLAAGTILALVLPLAAWLLAANVASRRLAARGGAR